MTIHGLISHQTDLAPLPSPPARLAGAGNGSASLLPVQPRALSRIPPVSPSVETFVRIPADGIPNYSPRPPQKDLFTIKVNDTGQPGLIFKWSTRGDLLAVNGSRFAVQIYNRRVTPRPAGPVAFSLQLRPNTCSVVSLQEGPGRGGLCDDYG